MTAALDQAWFSPRSVAVIGASANRAKWGYQYARSLLRAQDRRAVHLVNPAGGVILDQPVYVSCAALPEVPEVAVICVPSALAEAAIEEGLQAGIKRFVCITAGFAETGEDGARAQERLVARVRAAGARVIGPNCLGVYDVDAEFQCIAFWDVHPGSVGLVSQSGTVILELSARLARQGQGISRAVSIGNQADVEAAEVAASFAASDSTRALIAYIEDFKDGRALFGVLQQQARGGRPCILVSPSDAEPVRRAAASHTGSLVASDAVIDAACADAGVRRVRSISDALAAVRGILSVTPPRGRRIGVIADGGGSALLASAACVDAGLEAPAFSEPLRAEISKTAVPGSGVHNPVDAVGVLCLGDMAAMTRAVLASEEVDAVLLAGALNNVKDVIDPGEADQVACEIIGAAASAGKGLALATMYPADEAVTPFAARGVPVFEGAAEAARALALAIPVQEVRPIPLLPRPSAPPSTELDTSYHGARRMFATYGASFPQAIEAAGFEDCLAAARELGFPVALKAMGLLHKSDAGGVALGLKDEAAFEAAWRRMHGRLSPPSFSIEVMAPPGGVEVVVGAMRAPRFGPTITVGAGGVLVELVHDAVTALAPVDEAYARAMIGRLRIARLLSGYRGGARLDVAALARLVASFSRLLVDHPEIEEAEINPVRVYETGLAALDARILTGRDQAQAISKAAPSQGS